MKRKPERRTLKFQQYKNKSGQRKRIVQGAFPKLKWLCLFICSFKKYDSINAEYGSDLKRIDAKLGNTKKLHALRWDTILLFMCRYLLNIKKSCEYVMS